MYIRRICTRKKLLMSQWNYKDICNRIADANVTFCDKGGAKRTLLRCGFRVHYWCKLFLFAKQRIKKIQTRRREFAPYFFTFHYYLLLSKNQHIKFKWRVKSEKVISKQSTSTNVLADFFGRGEPYRYMCRRYTRKKVVATASRCECVYKRTVEPSVPFCERGEMTARVTDFFMQ